ncbi:MAG: glyoxalase [Dehalococcoidia bacterium]|nr:glyoxalase [Dehalococcoidia bacterium]
MQLLDSYPIIVTERLTGCRDFYARWFGFEVAFEATWFVLLVNGSTSLAFMSPDHPSSPPTPATYTGDGMFLTLQVEDAAAEYDRLSTAGLSFDLPLTDEPWGQRRFGVVDPAGMWIDVVQQIEPAPGWWEPYIPA